MHVVCSIFDENNGGHGATIDFGFHCGIFNNSIFHNNKGSVIRVSLVVICNNEVCNLYLIRQ